MTYGEIIVGNAFNPSGDSDVAYVKNEFAKLINLAETVVDDKLKESSLLIANEDEDFDEEQFLKQDAVEIIYEMAIKSLLEAQMTLVKLITLPIK